MEEDAWSEAPVKCGIRSNPHVRNVNLSPFSFEFGAKNLKLDVKIISASSESSERWPHTPPWRLQILGTADL